MQQRLLEELANVTARPLSITFERLRRSGEVPDDWRWVKVTPVFKEGKKKDPGNDRPVCLTLVPRKVTEQILLEVTSKHMKKKVIANSQPVFTRSD